MHVSSPQGSLRVFRGLKVLRDLQSLGACITFRGNAVSRGLLCGNAVSRCLEVSLGVLVVFRGSTVSRGLLAIHSL